MAHANRKRKARSAKRARQPQAVSQLADRPEGIIPELNVAPVMAPVLGRDFAMFASQRDVESYDFSKLGITRLKLSFLEAISFPKNRQTPLTMLMSCRTSVGNRTNETDHGWSVARSRHVAERMRRWIVIRRQEYARQTLTVRNAIALAIGMLLFVVVGVGLQKSTEAPRKVPTRRQASFNPTPSPARSPQISVRLPPQAVRNDEGQVVEVRASDPGQVLIGYCEASTETVCDPVELAWSDPPHASVRFGVFRGFYDLRAIKIRQDPRTRQWIAGGDGEHIDDFLATTLRLGAQRIPIERLVAAR